MGITEARATCQTTPIETVRCSCAARFDMVNRILDVVTVSFHFEQLAEGYTRLDKPS